MRKSVSVMVTLALLGWVGVGRALAQVARRGKVTTFTAPSSQMQSAVAIDIVGRSPCPFPAPRAAPRRRPRQT